MKFFNTAGPVNQEKHYKLDPLTRWDIDEISSLINQEKYFILHAPRQTGKTSCLLALRDSLNGAGEYRTLYINVEIAQAARNDIDSGIRAIVQNMFSEYEIIFDLDRDKWDAIEVKTTANELLGRALSYISALSVKPFILLIDEIDSLVGDTLISVLRQIRSGYPRRPKTFPQTILLCGVRDIKDYRIQTTGEDIITGGSAFNIKAASLTIGDFSECEVRKLYNEHTNETGQIFEEACFQLVMDYTDGQPWLVNALAYEVTYNMKENRKSSVTITTEHFKEAKENLILSRVTHLDQLADKLEEPRVRRVIEPVLAGEMASLDKDDIEYCKDLGLIKLDKDAGIVISNAIYKEIIPRELTKNQQINFSAKFAPEWVNSDASLNTDQLISMFCQFWMENSEIWGKEIKGYNEAAPHLVFQAFLQRVANGHGIIEREYALGEKRVDLMLKWKSKLLEQRVVIELKILKNESLETVTSKALEQTANYAKKCDATESHIIIFDRDNKMNWNDKCYKKDVNHNNRNIKIWGA